MPSIFSLLTLGSGRGRNLRSAEKSQKGSWRLLEKNWLAEEVEMRRAALRSEALLDARVEWRPETLPIFDDDAMVETAANFQDGTVIFDDDAMVETAANFQDGTVQATSPISQGDTVKMPLASSGCGQIVAWNERSEPIVMFDWKCEELQRGGTEQYMTWFLSFMEDVRSEMQARGSLKWCWISLGGMPPLDLAQKLSAILDDKYPNLLRVAVIAPIPPRIRHFAEGMMHFLPKSLKEKFRLASTGPQVADMLACNLADLPQRVQELEKEKVEKPAGIFR